jgi:hypothetical protein
MLGLLLQQLELSDPVATPSSDGPMRQAACDTSKPRTTVEDALDKEPEVVKVIPGAGKVYDLCAEGYTEYQNPCSGNSNVFHPFASEMEWELAKWAKDSQTGDSAFMKLLGIPGVCSRTINICATGVLTYWHAIVHR